MAVTPRIQLNDADGVKVVRFQDNQLFDERTVREAADQIAAALPNDGTPIRLVVDFSDVSLISSTFLSKLILLQRRIDAICRRFEVDRRGGTKRPISDYLGDMTDEGRTVLRAELEALECELRQSEETGARRDAPRRPTPGEDGQHRTR